MSLSMRIAALVAGLTLLITPAFALAQTTNVDDLRAQGDACLNPPLGTDPSVTEDACSSFIQTLITVVLHLVWLNNNTSLSASPTSGAAPLSVTFTGTMPAGASLDFGDGTPFGLPTGAIVCSDSCDNAPPVTLNTTHTYQTAGTYTAKMTDSTGATLRKVTITVTGTSGGATLTATPTSGAVPLAVSFTATDPVTETVLIDYGDGSTSGDLAMSPQECAINSSCPDVYFASHTYASTGSYTATFETDPPCSVGLGAPCLSKTTLASQTIVVSGNTTTNLTVSPSSGVAPLFVSFTGPLTSSGYTLNFGDGNTQQINNPICDPLPGSTCPTNGTIATHTYSSAGTYTATLSGTPSPASATITVTGVVGTTTPTASATIATSSLTMTEAFDGSMHTISGTVSNAQSLTIETQGSAANSAIQDWTPTIANGGGAWAVNISTNFTPGTYSVKVIDKDSGANNGLVLATGTLTVNPPGPVSLPNPAIATYGTVSLNGSNQYVFKSTPGDTTAFTISAWVNYTGSLCSTIVSDSDPASGNDLILAMDRGSIDIRADKSGSQIVGGACSPLGMVSMPTGRMLSSAWHHVVWVNEGAKSTVYLDGNVLGTSSYPASNIGYHNQQGFQVGRMYDGSPYTSTGAYQHGINYFPGQIGDVRYYTSALTADQVSSLYSGGQQYTSVTITPSSDSVSTASVCGGTNILAPGATLVQNQYINSCSGKYGLKLQTDGNLVLYDNSTGKSVWASNTPGQLGQTLVMQGDGNLVLYNSTSSGNWIPSNAIWSSLQNGGLLGQPGGLVVGDDGRLVIVSVLNNSTMWATKAATSIANTVQMAAVVEGLQATLLRIQSLLQAMVH